MTMQAGVCVTNALIMVKDGVDEKDFEKFIKEEWSQSANAAKGITCHVAKADRGDRETGHYMATVYWDSFELRDWYFPIDSDGKKSLSEEGQKEFDRTGFGDADGKLRELAEVEYRGSGIIFT